MRTGKNTVYKDLCMMTAQADYLRSRPLSAKTKKCNEAIITSFINMIQDLLPEGASVFFTNRKVIIFFFHLDEKKKRF